MTKFFSDLLIHAALRIVILGFTILICLNALAATGVLDDLFYSLRVLGIDINISDLIFHPLESLEAIVNGALDSVLQF